MTDKIFAEGLKVTSHETKYGEIIKLGIKYDKFTEFMAKHVNDRGYINIDLKRSQRGSWYSELNTYGLKADESIIQWDDSDEPPF